MSSVEGLIRRTLAHFGFYREGYAKRVASRRILCEHPRRNPSYACDGRGACRSHLDAGRTVASHLGNTAPTVLIEGLRISIVGQ